MRSTATDCCRRPRLLLSVLGLAAVSTALLMLMLTVSPQPAVAQTPLQELCFGIVLPLTSDRHIESLRILDAITLATNDLNADPLVLPNHVVHFLTDPNMIDSHGFVRYGARQMHSQTEEGTCQNGTLVVAVVGDIDDSVCEQMATVATLQDVPMVSPGCRDGRFDAREDGVAYPMFARTISNLLAEADVVKALMAHFSFPEIVLWHSDSTVGSALGHSFAGTDFEVVDVPVPYTDTGVEVQRSLDRILTLRVRIIFVHAEETLGRLMMATAKRNNMLNGDYLFVGSSLWTFGSDEAHRVDFNEDERTYLQGVVGISLPTPDAQSLEHFEDRLTTLTPSLYAPFNTQAIVSTVWHAYDAVKLLGLSAHNLTQRGVSVSGVGLMNVIRTGGVSFSGVVGDRIRMLTDGGLDPLLEITNFQSGAFVSVGSWSAEGLALTGNIVWPGLNAELNPSPDVPRTLLKLNGALPDVGLAVMIILLLGSALLHYLIHVNRNHEVIKAASPMFCHIIVFGSTLAYVMCGVASLDFTTYCRIVPPLISVSFSTIFAALLAKTYRIHRIFNSEGLKINAPTSAYLLATTAAVAGYDVIVSIVFMTVDTPVPVNLPSPTDDTTQYPACGMDQAQAWLLIYILPKILMLAFGAWLAYKVRHLNHNFNEAKYISIALYNVIILSAILLSLVETFTEVNAVYALKTMGCAFSAFVTVCILFVPKFWDIYVTKDWIDYHSNSSYISGVLVHKSSKTGNRTADGILAGVASGHPAAGVVLAGPGTNTGGHGIHHRKPHSGNGGGGGGGRGSPTQYLHRPAKLPSATDGNNRRSEVAGPNNSAKSVAGAMMRPAGGGGGNDSGDAPVRRANTLAGKQAAGVATPSRHGAASPPPPPLPQTQSSAGQAGIDLKSPTGSGAGGAGAGDAARDSVLAPLPAGSSSVPMTTVKTPGGAAYRVVGHGASVSPSNSPRNIAGGGGGGFGRGADRTPHSQSLLGTNYNPNAVSTPPPTDPVPLSMVPGHGARGSAGAAVAGTTDSTTLNSTKPIGGGGGGTSTTIAASSGAGAGGAAAGARLSPHGSMSQSATMSSVTIAASSTNVTVSTASGQQPPAASRAGGSTVSLRAAGQPPAPIRVDSDGSAAAAGMVVPVIAATSLAAPNAGAPVSPPGAITAPLLPGAANH